MSTSLLDQSLGQIACDIPGATRIFHHYHIDFCCGGRLSLRVAMQEKGIAPDEIVKALEQARLQADSEPSSTDWRSRPVSELIDHIEQRFHETHRAQLPELIRLARRVEQRHIDNTACPLGLSDALEALQQELESHMYKEERVLFPMLKQGADLVAQNPIAVMRLEHDHHGDNLDDILLLTNQLHLPVGACNTWAALYTGLEQFKTDLMEHIHLENNVLFMASSTRAQGDHHEGV